MRTTCQNREKENTEIFAFRLIGIQVYMSKLSWESLISIIYPMNVVPKWHRTDLIGTGFFFFVFVKDKNMISNRIRLWLTSTITLCSCYMRTYMFAMLGIIAVCFLYLNVNLENFPDYSNLKSISNNRMQSKSNTNKKRTHKKISFRFHSIHEKKEKNII